jgi:type II secretory pathway predicted ATPase ExeA
MKPAAADKLGLIFKRLWGAGTIPFCAGAQPAFEHPAFEAVSAKLAQLCAIGASGVLHGPNGVGKSYLLHDLLSAKLPDKAFKTVVLTHSSLSGSDLLRALCLSLELRPQFRRSDNVAAITAAWKALGSRWPVLLVEEAQNLSAVALEELRLLACAKLEAVPFSLVLIGDPSLLAKLQLGVHAPLRSRLGYCLQLGALDAPQSRRYVEHALRSATIHANPFQPEALELLVQAGGGLPRTINHLAQRAMEAAASVDSVEVTAAHLQAAIDRLPWLVQLHLGPSAVAA